MYLPDVNVWLALAFPAHAHHNSARAWFDGAPADRLRHYCRLTQIGFLRIANNPAALGDAAVTQDQAWQLYDHFVAHGQVAFVDEPAGFEPLWRRLASRRQFSPKVWTDAYLAAFGQVVDFEIVTFDQGFSQFKGVRSTILS